MVKALKVLFFSLFLTPIMIYGQDSFFSTYVNSATTTEYKTIQLEGTTLDHQYVVKYGVFNKVDIKFSDTSCYLQYNFIPTQAFQFDTVNKKLLWLYSKDITNNWHFDINLNSNTAGICTTYTRNQIWYYSFEQYHIRDTKQYGNTISVMYLKSKNYSIQASIFYLSNSDNKYQASIGLTKLISL